jgi:hypothetical protein
MISGRILFTLCLVFTFCGEAIAESLTAEQVQRLFPDDDSSGFGSTLAMDDDTAVIGAWSDDDNGRLSGSAYAFTRSGGVWTQETKLLPHDGAERDYFGSSVAVDGDTVIVGASGDDDNGSSSGSVYVFRRTNGAWTQEAKIVPDDARAGDRFGSLVAVSGDHALIRGRIGPVYAFFRWETVWYQVAKLDVPGVSAISLDGDTAVFGLPNVISFIGAALVFRRSGFQWTEEALLMPDDWFWGHRFGWDVAVDGDTALVAKVFGSTYAFTRSDGIWTQEAKLVPGGSTSADFSGTSLALDRGTAVIGRSGTAYLFTAYDGVWTQNTEMTDDDGQAGGSFGLSVAVDGHFAMVGMSLDDDDRNAVDVFLLYPSNMQVLSIHDLILALMGHDHDLVAPLQEAVQLLEDNDPSNDGEAVDSLMAFVAEVEEHRGLGLTDEEADELIAETRRIMALLSFRSLPVGDS